MCVCVCEQTDSLGRSEHTTASGFKQCLISIPLAHTQMFFAACTSRDFFYFFFDRGKKFSAETIYSHSISACDRCFSLPLTLVSNFMKPYFFSGAAGWRAGGLQLVSRLLSFKRRFTSCLRQELGCLFFFFFKDAHCLVGEDAAL